MTRGGGRAAFAVALAIALASIAGGCSKSIVSSSDADADSGATNVFGGSTMADTVLSVLNARLEAQAKLTSTQASVVTTAAQTALSTASSDASLRLAATAPTVYLNHYSNFAADLTIGAMSSFNLASLGISTRDQLNSVLSTIVGNTFVEMKGRIADVDGDSFPAFLGTLTKKTIVALASSNYSAQDIAGAVSTIMAAALGHMGAAGVLDENNGAAVCSAIVQGAVEALPNVGLGSASSAAAGPAAPAPASTPGSPVIADSPSPGPTYVNTNITAANIGAYSPQQVLAAFDPSKLIADTAGAGPDVYYAVILYNLMDAAIPALVEAGFASDDIPFVIEHMVYSLLVSLTESGLDEYFVLSVADKALFGAVEDIGALGLSSAQIVSTFGLIQNGVVAALGSMTAFDVDAKRTFFKIAAFILASRINEVSPMTGADLEDLYIEVAARGTFALTFANLSSPLDYAEAGATIVSQIGAVAQARLNAAPPAGIVLTEVVQDVMAAAMAAGAVLDQTFTKDLEAALKASSAFGQIVGPSYDYQGQFAAAEARSAFYAAYAKAVADHYGSLALADFSAFNPANGQAPDASKQEAEP